MMREPPDTSSQLCQCGPDTLEKGACVRLATQCRVQDFGGTKETWERGFIGLCMAE